MRRQSTNTNRAPVPIALVLMLSLLLAACGAGSEDAGTDDSTTTTLPNTTTSTTEPEDHDHDHDHDHEEDHDHEHEDEDEDHDHDSEEPDDDVTELDEARRLLVVAAHEETSISMIDLEDGSPETLTLESPASFNSTMTEDGRFLLAGHSDGVTVIDTGVWSQPHGDHFHHYTTAPSVLGRVEGANPSHLISHTGLNALYFDGTGTASVVAEDDLVEGDVSVVAEVGASIPHHGFVLPLHDGYFITVPTEDIEGMPDMVGIAAEDGSVVAQFDCPMTHGEASLGENVAAACSEGIVVLSESDGEWTETYIPYPEVDDEDPYGFGPARAWFMRPSKDHSLLAAAMGSEHLLITDVTGESSTAIDIEANITVLGVEFTNDGDVVVLTVDGFIHLVDPGTGSVVSSVEAISPFGDGNPDEPYRQLTVTGDHLYVNDPASNSVVEIAIGDELTIERTFELDIVPGFIGIANG